MIALKRTSAIACLLGFALVQAQESPKKVMFCTILSSPERYDKELVETDIVLNPGYHSLVAFDPACAPKDANPTTAEAVLPEALSSTAAGRKLSGILRRQHRANARVLAVFYGSGGPYGPDAARFRLVIERLETVEEGK
jgi:hypothetical protein